MNHSHDKTYPKGHNATLAETLIEGSGTFTNWTIQSGLSVTRAADVGYSSTGTRNADNWTITFSTSDFSFNEREGTLFIVCNTNQPNNINQTGYGACFGSSTSNYIGTGQFGWQSYYGSYGALNGSAISTLDQQGFTSGTFYKFALAYKDGDIASCINGGTISTSTFNVPYVNMLNIGSLLGTDLFLNGHVKHLAYFPKRLSNEDLQFITQ